VRINFFQEVFEYLGLRLRVMALGETESEEKDALMDYIK
jgi:hypothetical protein